MKNKSYFKMSKFSQFMKNLNFSHKIKTGSERKIFYFCLWKKNINNNLTKKKID